MANLVFKINDEWKIAINDYKPSQAITEIEIEYVANDSSDIAISTTMEGELLEDFIGTLKKQEAGRE